MVIPIIQSFILDYIFLNETLIGYTFRYHLTLTVFLFSHSLPVAKRLTTMAVA